MADRGDQNGTPVTQQWVVTMLLGYFVVGPLALLVLTGIVALAKWLFW